MKTFDDLEVRRPKLARSYLELLKAQPGRPIALFAPCHVGKTFFLHQDLTPAARASGFTPVYADIWLHRTSPLSAINHALEEALDDATVPASAVGKAAKTPVKKVGALGAALEFGDEPKRRALPAEPALRRLKRVGILSGTGGVSTGVLSSVGSPPFIPNKPVVTSIHEKPVTRASEFPRAERPIECWEIGRATC
jgi:hypothetical protein